MGIVRDLAKQLNDDQKSDVRTWLIFTLVGSLSPFWIRFIGNLFSAGEFEHLVSYIDGGQLYVWGVALLAPAIFGLIQRTRTSWLTGFSLVLVLVGAILFAFATTMENKSATFLIVTGLMWLFGSSYCVYYARAFELFAPSPQQEWNEEVKKLKEQYKRSEGKENE